MKRLLYILFFISLFVNAQNNPNISPWDACQDGNPIGGGIGYDAIITSGDVTVTTSDTPATLKTKIEGATSGQVVFIEGNVVMNLGTTRYFVPAGVTVASDRGNGASDGALLYTNEMKYQGSGDARPVFVSMGNGTRYTGFRFRGPYGFVGDYSPDAPGFCGEPCRRVKTGISSNWDNTEIDNMRLWNWPFSAINISRWVTGNTAYFGAARRANGSKIHHNYIHNNLQNGSGYGIDFHSSLSGHAYANVLHSNRHDIRGGMYGVSDESWEASCNVVIREFRSDITSFDLNGPDGDKVYTILNDGSGNVNQASGGSAKAIAMQSGNMAMNFEHHPEAWCDDDVWSGDRCLPKCCKSIYIHHNDFQDDGFARHGTSAIRENISLVGIPLEPGASTVSSTWYNDQDPAIAYIRIEYNRTYYGEEKGWNASGTWVNPDIHHLYDQSRTVFPVPKGNVTLLGNTVNPNWGTVSLPDVSPPTFADPPTPPGQSGQGPPTGSGDITGIRFTQTDLTQFWTPENTANPSATLEVLTTETGETYSFEAIPRASNDDKGFFTFSGSTVTMDNGSTFNPDFENPQDANGNNIYGMDVQVTSTSGKTYTQDMAFYITNLDEGGEVFVDKVEFDNTFQTMRRGQTPDLSITFNDGLSTPDNTEVYYQSDDESVISSNGTALFSGTTQFHVISRDTIGGTKFDTMTVNVNNGRGKPERKQ